MVLMLFLVAQLGLGNNCLLKDMDFFKVTENTVFGAISICRVSIYYSDLPENLQKVARPKVLAELAYPSHGEYLQLLMHQMLADC